ncbi:unnamed protein product [Staurois parvus]|uniref:Uncharacterized protein n=1 Tax=Staurois parvus TaxID=386267 RepID=A0ABN9BVA1_9NEOB|nr:unnamed protein product [Staurois parvus]
MYKKMTFFNILKFPAGSGARTSQGPEHGSRMPTSAGRDGLGQSRGHIAGAKDKVSSVGNP